jgi:ATP-dependent helicase/nuclease subunit B
MLENNGFIIKTKNGKYTTLVRFGPDTYSREFNERITKIHLNVAEQLVREYVPAVLEAIKDVNDIYIPGAAAGKGLLTEYDRQRLTEHGAVLTPNAKEKTYIQKFYLYLALTKPSHQVYLTYSKSSAEGTSLRPSYLISDLLRLFSSMQVQETECAFSEQELTKESGIRFFIDGLRKKEEGLTPEWKELFTWYQKNPELRVKISKLLEATFYKKREAALSRETAKRLYGEILENSVTRLEKFAACAYAHFLLYGLELKERQEYRFQAVDLGNLFHSAIEKFSGKLEKEGYSWTSIPEEKKEAWIRGSVEECITDYGNSILYSSARNEYVIQRLTRMLRRSIWALTKQLEKGKFVPEGYEISFGAYPGLAASDISLQG